MNLLDHLVSIMSAVPNKKRTVPSRANLGAAKRILEHRRRNWPNCVPVPQSRAHYLPTLRKGGGQREVGV